MAENSAEPSTPAGKRGGSRRPASFDQERVVRRYLSAIETSKAGRGTKRTADAVGNRITKVDELLVSADPLRRVHLTQERIELHAEFVRVTNGNSPDRAQLERDFVRVARSYSDRTGITYAAWRQVGVDAEVLERAGIHKADKKPPSAAVRAKGEAAAGGPAQAAPNGASPAADAPAPAPAPESPATTTATGSPAADAPAPDAPAPAPDATAQASPGPGDKTAGKASDVEPGAKRAEGTGGEVTEAVRLDELAALLTDAPAEPDGPK